MTDFPVKFGAFVTIASFIEIYHLLSFRNVISILRVNPRKDFRHYGSGSGIVSFS
jgi:hypothetical protein